jgi:hypothetical protein
MVTRANPAGFPRREAPRDMDIGGYSVPKVKQRIYLWLSKGTQYHIW